MKSELLQNLGENRDQLLAAIAGLPESQITTLPVVGVWTVKDVVCHIAYWERVILDHVRESYAEGRPRPMRDDENADVINPRQVAKRQAWRWARVLAEFTNVRAALIGKVASLSESELSFQVPNPWWNEERFYPVGQMIAEDAIGHCREHLEQIKRGQTEKQA
jgi:uncharacterized damage-inducible protein DinB